MNPAASSLVRLSFVALALSLAGCARGCSSNSEDSSSGKTAAPLGASARDGGRVPGAPVARTARLDGAKTTQEILSALHKDCLACAEKNGCLDPAQQSGVCETVAGNSKINGQSEVSLCLDALRCVFTTKCANNGEESQCLCGKTDIIECMEGRSAPQGACVDEFRKDFGGDNKKMYDDFINPAYGVGRANQIIQCAIPTCSVCRIP
jgi:hypothetical protein